MDRREAIKRMAVLTGGALSLSTVAGIMGGCTAESDASFNPRTLSIDQNELVTVISEHIIPETDTPGAKAASVNEYIDKMLTDWHTEEERDHFLSGLKHVDEVSNNLGEKDFLDLDHEMQLKVLEQLQQEASEEPWSDSGHRAFFKMMKELTIVGYYTSEVGATKELQTSIVPGYYDGCKDYSEMGVAWSNAGN